MNMVLLKSRASVRFPKRTIDAAKQNVNEREICFILANVLTAQRAKIYELDLFNNNFAQLIISLFGSFFMIFPGRSGICYL